MTTDASPPASDLQAFEFIAHHEIKRRTGLEAKAVFSATTDQFVSDLRVRLSGQTLGTELHRYPATWWDALKERFLPRLLEPYLPVRYAAVEVSVTAYYPKLLPGQDAALYAEVTKVQHGQ